MTELATRGMVCVYVCELMFIRCKLPPLPPFPLGNTLHPFSVLSLVEKGLSVDVSIHNTYRMQLFSFPLPRPLEFTHPAIL